MESITTRARGFTGRGRNVKRSSRWFGGLFWWTMLIILLALGAVASWTFCLFAFSYPEKPINYWVLQKFHKLEPPKRFSNFDAPSNRSYLARDLYDRFHDYEERHFKEINSLMLRNYIENFARAESKFTMNMVGKFRIEARRPLGDGDLMASGTVLLARCIDFPDVVIQYLMPGKPGSVPDDVLKVGDTLDLGTKSRSQFAPFNVVLHISRTGEGQYCFCIVPILFSRDHIARGVQLTLEPPQRLDVEAPMPPLPIGAKAALALPVAEDEVPTTEPGGAADAAAAEGTPAATGNE